MNELLELQLSKVCWIGGATDAGKTSVARELSRRHRVPVYHYDALDVRHHNRLAELSSEYAPFLTQTLDERWVHPRPEDMASRAWRAFQDRFPLVVEDLTALSLPEGMPVIAEGYGLTPKLVSPFLTKPEQLVCLFPTDEFKVGSMERRGKGHFGGEVSDPRRAAENLRRRDGLIADRLMSEAQSLGIDVIEIDGSTPTDDLATLVGLRFGLQ
jgi:2-phosphoglycerate kinase